MNRVYMVLWTVFIAVLVVVGVTAIVEWRQPDVEAVREVIHNELAIRDSLDQMRADSILARTDSIIALVAAADSITVETQRLIWLDLFAGLHNEHTAIIANQAAQRRREVQTYSALRESICWWTSDRARICR